MSCPVETSLPGFAGAFAGFVGVFADPQKSAALLDGLAPAFLAAYPLTFIAGYLLGPKRQSRLAQA